MCVCILKILLKTADLLVEKGYANNDKGLYRYKDIS